MNKVSESAVNLYNAILEFDIQVRINASKLGINDFRAIDEMMSCWLEYGLKIYAYEKDDYKEIRDAVEEARWILKSPDEIFDHPRFVELRDKAIDDMRKGDVV